MKKNESNEVVSLNPLMATGIEKMILVIRDKQVLLDRDLAVLYGVETRTINQAVKRNIERFPERNCFQLTKDELPDSLKSPIVILNESGNKRGLHVKKMPFAFTEQGVAMLASVLHSETAIRVSLQIMDAFVAMRHFMMQNGGFVNRLSNVEAKIIEQDKQMLVQNEKIHEHDRKFDEVFEAMDRGELQSKGLFYNNQIFDAYVFVCGLIRQAKKKIVLVDRYVDEKTLAMMLKRKMPRYRGIFCILLPHTSERSDLIALGRKAVPLTVLPPLQLSGSARCAPGGLACCCPCSIPASCRVLHRAECSPFQGACPR